MLNFPTSYDKAEKQKISDRSSCRIGGFLEVSCSDVAQLGLKDRRGGALYDQISADGEPTAYYIQEYWISEVSNILVVEKML